MTLLQVSLQYSTYAFTTAPQRWLCSGEAEHLSWSRWSSDVSVQWAVRPSPGGHCCNLFQFFALLCIYSLYIFIQPVCEGFRSKPDSDISANPGYVNEVMSPRITGSWHWKLKRKKRYVCYVTVAPSLFLVLTSSIYDICLCVCVVYHVSVCGCPQEFAENREHLSAVIVAPGNVRR